MTMIRSVRLCRILLTLAIAFNLASVCYALETKTHQAINEYIARGTFNGFSLKSYLQAQLGIQEGVAASIQSKTVSEWLGYGGIYEDIPYWYMPYLRSVNHFHNPLTKQGFSGFWGIGFLSGVSSIQWSQESFGTQGPGGHYSWFDVRDYFYKALTATDKTTRDQNFADTFRGLGQLMHLVEDLSVPEHTRNDSHGPCWLSYNYECWAENKITDITISTYPPIYFDSSQIGNLNPLASIPIANLFDTNQYNGTNPNVTLQNNVGLSEYTNVNFLSPGTAFISDFPYPNWSSIVLYDWTDPGTGKKTTYLKKLGQGETGGNGQIGNGEHIDHLAAARWGYKLLPSWLQQNGIFLKLDDACYTEYASRLIPRAVGYSAGFLNYFFRGSIEITVPSSGVYSLITPSQTGFTSIKLMAKNATSNSEEMTDGSIQLVVKYKVAQSDPFQSGPVPKASDFSYIVAPEKNNVRSLSRASTTELNFDLSQNPIPLWATDVDLQVVYKGALGNEAEAVAVGFKDIGEPTPMDLLNNMDRICLYSTWYVAGSPEAIAQVDTNHNGIADEYDVYAHDLTNIYMRILPYGVAQYASPSLYNFSVPSLPAGSFLRAAYFLSDYQLYFGDYSTVTAPDPADEGTHYISRVILSGESIRRQTDYSEDSIQCGGAPPCYVDNYPEFVSIRGFSAWGRAGEIWNALPYPTGSSCLYVDLP